MRLATSGVATGRAPGHQMSAELSHGDDVDGTQLNDRTKSPGRKRSRKKPFVSQLRLTRTPAGPAQRDLIFSNHRIIKSSFIILRSSFGSERRVSVSKIVTEKPYCTGTRSRYEEKRFVKEGGVHTAQNALLSAFFLSRCSGSIPAS